MNEDAARETGVLGVANALVSYDPVYEGLVAQLLGRTLVVDTIDHAIVIQRKYRQTLRMVTLEGELLSPGGSMTGGSFRNNSNLLGRRREIEELEKSVQGLAKELREIQQELEEKKNKRNEIRDLRTELNEKLQRQYIEQNTVRLNLEKRARKRRKSVWILKRFRRRVSRLKIRSPRLSGTGKSSVRKCRNRWSGKARCRRISRRRRRRLQGFAAGKQNIRRILKKSG